MSLFQVCPARRWRSRLWLSTLVAIGCGDVSIAPTAELAAPHATVEHTATLDAVDGGSPGDASTSPEARVAACVERIRAFADEHRYDDEVHLGDQILGRYEAILSDAAVDCRRKAHFPTDDEAWPTGRAIHLWPDGVVKYSIDDDFEVPDPNRPGRTKADRIRELVRSFAMQHHVTFVELPPDERPERRLHITNGVNTCKGNADVGYERGLSIGDEFPRKLRLRDDPGDPSMNIAPCFVWDSQDVVHHELGHTIGMAHEQQRPDWRQNIVRNIELVPSEFRDDYLGSAYSGLRVDSPYDYDSIMHYPGWLTTLIGRPTALARKRWAYLANQSGASGVNELGMSVIRRVSGNPAVGLGANVRALEGGPSGAGIEFLASGLTDGPDLPNGTPDIVTFDGSRLWRAALTATSWSALGPAAPFVLERAELAFGDVTGDGLAEVVVAGKNGSTTVIGIFSFVTSTWQSRTLVEGPPAQDRWLHVADWDGNGTRDVVVYVDGVDAELAIIRPSLGSMTPTMVFVPGRPAFLLVGNFDGDASAETMRAGESVIRNTDGTIVRTLARALPYDPDQLGLPRVMRRIINGGLSTRDEIVYFDFDPELRQLTDGQTDVQLRDVSQWGLPSLDDTVVGSFISGGVTTELWISRDPGVGGLVLSASDLVAIDTAYPDDANPGHFMAIGGGVFVPFPCAIDEAFGYCP